MNQKSTILTILIGVLFFFTPVFAAENETNFNVRDFSAVGDGQTLDTPAVQKAINSAAEKGGGTVLFPPGTYLSGTVYLKSNVHLRFERGAELLGTKDLTQYYQPPSKDHYVYGTAGKHLFLYGEKVENVKIGGQGVIDGNWATYIDPISERERRGPAAVMFVHSKNITLDTITVTRSPGWAITFFDCQNVKILGIKVINCKCDGINPVCCQDVLYDGVYIDGTGDDPITIKNEGVLDKPHATRNITIRNTTVKNTGHPGVKIGTGTAGTFENITIDNCFFENVGDFFTIQLMRPGLPQDPDRYIDNVVVKNITVKNSGRLFDITTMGVSTPVIRNMSFEDIRFSGGATGSRILGLAKSPINGITLKNITVTATHSGPMFLKTQYVSNLTIENISLNGQPIETFLQAEHGNGLTTAGLIADNLNLTGPAIRLNNFQNASLDTLNLGKSENLVFVSGPCSKNINLKSWNAVGVKNPLLADSDVPADAMQPTAGKVAVSQLTLPETIPAGKPFTAAVSLQNIASPGVFKVSVMLADQCIGQQWLWLDPSAQQTLNIPCTPIYQPSDYQVRAESLSRTITIQKTPADIRYGEFCEVEIPATLGAAATFNVPIGNFGGSAGDKTIELKLDGRLVDSKTITLHPGEQSQVRLECAVPDNQSHRWQVGEFPEWPYATFRNVNGRFFLGREKIKIEAGGRFSVQDDLAAVYFNDVQGDFDLIVNALSQTEHTGHSTAIGLVVRNEITDPSSPGFSLYYRCPKYGAYHYWYLDLNGDGKLDPSPLNGGAPRFPFWMKLEKRGQNLQIFTSKDRQKWEPSDKAITLPSAAAIQDVGVYANASSADNESATVEFTQLSLNQVTP
jgi:hypothetical protein